MRLPDLLRVLRPPTAVTVHTLVALASCAVLALSCAQGVGGTTTPTPTGGDDSATGDDDQQGNGDDDDVNMDSGAFGQEDASADAGGDDDDAPGREAGPEAGPADAGDASTADASDASDAASDAGGSTAPICPEMTSGTLNIVEVMIASKSGTDEGEWIELINPSTTCAVQLYGFTVTSPRGSEADTATLDDGYRVGPGETVIVADSLVSALNNGLTGKIYAWNDSDVLANGGDTVSVLRGLTVLDTFDYSQGITIDDGSSLEYPAGCALKNRGVLSNWQYSMQVFGTSMGCGTSGTTACMGTPNAPNDDVTAVPACE